MKSDLFSLFSLPFSLLCSLFSLLFSPLFLPLAQAISLKRHVAHAHCGRVLVSFGLNTGLRV